MLKFINPDITVNNIMPLDTEIGVGDSPVPGVPS